MLFSSAHDCSAASLSFELERVASLSSDARRLSLSPRSLAHYFRVPHRRHGSSRQLVQAVRSASCLTPSGTRLTSVSVLDSTALDNKLSVWINVDGSPAPVNGVKSEEKKTSGYIESKDGATFTVSFEDDRTTLDHPYVVRVFVDGTRSVLFGLQSTSNLLPSSRGPGKMDLHDRTRHQQ